VDFVRRWSEKTEIGAGRFIAWLDITTSKLYDWRERYGKVNEHNGWAPRDFWLEDWEKQAIIGFHLKNPLDGSRRLTFMMLDADIVAVSPTSAWRVLGQAGMLSNWNGKPSKKDTGFEQPLAGHQHWHIDVSYINISGTFSYLCSILDGCSRYIVNWDLRESMTEADIEIILERANREIWLHRAQDGAASQWGKLHAMECRHPRGGPACGGGSERGGTRRRPGLRRARYDLRASSSV
jgi:putative transposase